MGEEIIDQIDQMSNSSRNGNSEDDLMDILNIPKDHLLDQNSPERLEDLPQEQQDSEEEPQMETLNTPTIMIPDPAVLWGRSGTQQNVFLQPRNRGIIETDSTKTTNIPETVESSASRT